MKTGFGVLVLDVELAATPGLAKMDAIGGTVAPRSVSLGGGRCRAGILVALTYDHAECRAGVRSALSGRRPRK